MRTVLRNHQEVAHYWANEVQSEGRAGNMFFENGVIYSYGYHFPIAKHYDNNIILFTNRGYSISTSKHISYTRRAIPSGYTIIDCYDPKWPANQDNFDTAIREIEFNLKKSVRARSNKAYYIRTARNVHADLVLLRDTFKIKGWRIPKYDFSDLQKIEAAFVEKLKKEEAKKRREKAEAGKEFMEDLKIWKGGHTNQLRHRHQQEFDYCRIDYTDKVVETTRSANAPLDEVKTALKLIKKGKPIVGLKLGYYTIVSYSKGILKVGCHTFPKSEIDWLMKQLNI